MSTGRNAYRGDADELKLTNPMSSTKISDCFGIIDTHAVFLRADASAARGLQMHASMYYLTALIAKCSRKKGWYAAPGDLKGPLTGYFNVPL
jgi:hypothetical protein